MEVIHSSVYLIVGLPQEILVVCPVTGDERIPCHRSLGHFDESFAIALQSASMSGLILFFSSPVYPF
jgi:hypothetical protein